MHFIYQIVLFQWVTRTFRLGEISPCENRRKHKRFTQTHTHIYIQNRETMRWIGNVNERVENGIISIMTNFIFIYSVQ